MYGTRTPNYRIDSHAKALELLRTTSKTKFGKDRREFTNGYSMNSKKTKFVRRNADGSVAFCLHQTDVVTWHPDDTVTIDNYGTKSTSEFASSFVSGLSLHHPVTIRGEELGCSSISYGDWREGRTVCFSDYVTFRQGDNGWEPADPDLLRTVWYPELDRVKARKLAKQFHLRDFAIWLEVAPAHMRIEHTGFDLQDCLDALEKRDFVLASMFLPLVKELRGFGVNIKPLNFVTRRGDEHVTMASLGKLKLAMWEEEGALEKVGFTELPYEEFRRREQRARELAKLTYARYGAA